MKLTKFGHSCVRLDSNDHRTVIDPGGFTDVITAATGAETIFITHEHPDHVDDELVVQLLAGHYSVRLYAPETVIERLSHRVATEKRDISEHRLKVIAAGDELDLPGFHVQAVGGQHEIIHPQIPQIDNIGYVLNGSVYHPGDSFIVPAGVEIDTLCLPINAPWASLEDTLDFMISVRPRQAVPIHDGLLSDNGHTIYDKQVQAFAERYGIELNLLAEGEHAWTR